MVRLFFSLLLFNVVVQGTAQVQSMTLSLDSCRAMALRNNRHIGMSRLKQDIARNASKAARTKYLPKLDVIGGYQFTSKEISLLSNSQKSALPNIGTVASTQLGNELGTVVGGLVQQGIITPEQATHLGKMFDKMGASMGNALNNSGQRIVDAFDTDTRNVFMASAMITQPIFMGGGIVAANKIATINENLTRNETEAARQNTLYDIDRAYWTTVSLKHKKKLAESFLELVKRLDGDVAKMIKEGVATRADRLKVEVKVNEAEMTLTQVENGLSLSKMLLCQLCGIPLETELVLADEDKDEIEVADVQGSTDVQIALENRPELKMLQNAVDISMQTTNVIRAAYLPQVALTAGYTVTNPNLYNGFENKFSGVWNIGVMLRIPVWNWFEGQYKVRSSKIATSIANLEMTDAQEKVELQVSQSSFKVKEANKRLVMADRNVKSADENLRTANLGFKEGVMQTTDVMAAQTAWMQAKSQKIDAEIDVALSKINLKKALGILQ